MKDETLIPMTPNQNLFPPKTSEKNRKFECWREWKLLEHSKIKIITTTKPTESPAYDNSRLVNNDKQTSERYY